MSESLYEIPINCDFSTITNANNSENDCSPKLTDSFFSTYSGILINAPKEVLWPKGVSFADNPVGPWGETEGPLRLMVAGLIRLPYKSMGLKGNFSDTILVIAVNQATGESYSGRMPQPDLLPEPDFINNLSERPRSEKDGDVLISDNFNFDLVHDLGIPIMDASYHVYATLGEYKSNTVTIKTSMEK
ncbi:hypothetical protein [Colwellia echini]|uniref:Uncharacterized protein n=1 Tax=Colwellia echini TaxID=1982103 RepID=A0ABY3MTT7_9GAMM|nr:hypothetical protein [Colwellia echini]TYK64492.1 hypothetical protein CWS31_015425 [Colwellia echini]